MKYIIEKAKGAFYAGSESLTRKGLKLRHYLNLNSVRKAVASLHVSASSVLFRGVSKNEQNKILGQAKAAKRKAPKRKPAKKRK